MGDLQSPACWLSSGVGCTWLLVRYTNSHRHLRLVRKS